MTKKLNIKITLIGCVLLTTLLGLSTSGQNSEDYLITPNSVGKIGIGMTIADARKVFKNATFEQNDYVEEGIQVEVRNGEDLLMSFTTDQQDLTSDENGKVPIDETAKIESVTFSDPKYKTADGIHIGSPVKDAEQSFGKIIKIELWEYDGSEHAEFANAPKTYSFTIGPKMGSPGDVNGGIYAKDQYSTTKFAADAILASMTVSKPAGEEASDPNANYLITKNSAGDVRIGMTISEARKAMRNAVFSRSSDGEGLALVAIGKKDDAYMTVYAAEEDYDLPIDENAKIEFIEVWDSRFKTKEGVHPQMKLSDAEKIYGKITRVMMSEIESREYAYFANHPPGVSFRLTANEGDAGVYAEGMRETTKYATGASVFSISISEGSE